MWRCFADVAIPGEISQWRRLIRHMFAEQLFLHIAEIASLMLGRKAVMWKIYQPLVWLQPTSHLLAKRQLEGLNRAI